MASKTVLAYLLVVNIFMAIPSLAYWRMSCMGVVGVARIDPIVAPNVTSPHMHTLKGSNAISPEATADDLLNGQCTSCMIAQDKSSYWSPQLYFYDTANNSFVMVPEVAGFIAYYKYVPAFISNGSYVNPVAIPNGMKMLSGNTYRRDFTLPVPDPPLPWTGPYATQDALQQKAIGFNCLNYNKPPEGTLQRHFLPNKTFLEENCPDGIRAEVLFPICWNGKDLTSSSPNFTSHVAYSSAGANGGSCPPGYDVVINQLLFETIYPTQSFIGRDGFYTFSNGDPTGYGYHGDTLTAWEPGVQEAATAQCGNPVTSDDTSGEPSACPLFKIQSSAAQAACKIAPPSSASPPGSGPGALANFNLNDNLVADAVNVVASLPGDNPVQSGPGEATPPAPPASSFAPGVALESSVLAVSSPVSAPTGALEPSSASFGAENAAVTTPPSGPGEVSGVPVSVETVVEVKTVWVEEKVRRRGHGHGTLRHRHHGGWW